jgi:type VI protein secretion system component VasF
MSLSPDDFDNYRFSSTAETRAIRSEVRQRQRFAEYLSSMRDAEEEERAETKRKIADGFVAVFVSVALVACFLGLALTWGAR